MGRPQPLRALKKGMWGKHKVRLETRTIAKALKAAGYAHVQRGAVVALTDGDAKKRLAWAKETLKRPAAQLQADYAVDNFTLSVPSSKWEMSGGRRKSKRSKCGSFDFLSPPR